MRFYDGKAFYTAPDIFESLDEQHLDIMQINAPNWQIPFSPIVTQPNAPVRIALNAYCGDDNEEAILQTNFSVWGQDRHPDKMFTVFQLYTNALAEQLGEHSIYYTNFIKVILPAKYFKASPPVGKILKQQPSMERLFIEALKQEVDFLVNNDCRIFIGFHRFVSEYFKNNIVPKSSWLYGESQGEIRVFSHNGKKCYFVPERHFSYYSKTKTASLISDLQYLLAK